MSNDWLNWPETQKLLGYFAPHGKDALRFVGGAVRDRLLRRAVKDIDVATPLLPEAVIALLESGGCKVVPTGLAHGTVTAVIDGRHFEITTLRRDTSCDGRHADVEYTQDWEEDARRRDFTMNALYLTPAGEYIDYFGGMDDAKNGYVRFIGEAKDRIREDYLRILRLFRFYAHYGQQPLDESALAACAELRGQISQLSGERIQHEMFKLLAAPQAYPALNLMRRTEVVRDVFGAMVVLATLRMLEDQDEQNATNVLLKLALVLRTVTEEAEHQLPQRWKLSGADTKRLKCLVEEPVLGEDISEAEQKKQLRHLGVDNFLAMVAISAAQQGRYSGYASMRALAREWEIPTFPVNGDDLKAKGLTQGAELGQALKKLEVLWEDSDYALDKNALLETL